MKTQITNTMLMALVINIVYTKAIGLTQGIMAREVGSDIWIATVLAILQGMFIMFVTVWVIRRLPQKNLQEQASVLFGKWVGKLVGLVIFIFFVGAYVGVLITQVYHLMDYFLPGFDIWVFVLAGILIPMYAIYHGIEVTARLAILGTACLVGLNLLLLAGSIHDIDITRLLPVFESGVKGTLWASRHNDTDWAMGTMMTAILLPLVRDQKEWGKSAVAGVGLGGFLIVMWPILECTVLSAPETGHYVISCMQMARSAEIGLFIHRYEMIMVALLGISLFLQLTMTMFCACISLSQTFGQKTYKPMIIPVAIMLGAVGYYFVADHIRAMRFLEVTWVPIAMPIAIGLPLLMWVLGFLFKKKLTTARSSV